MTITIAIPDKTPPKVSIVTPGTNVTITTGKINIAASASDNVGVTKVQFYKDGALVGTATSTPYMFVWNTSGLTGAHTLQARAYDAAGNIGSSSSISVTVKDPGVIPKGATPCGGSTGTTRTGCQ